MRLILKISLFVIMAGAVFAQDVPVTSQFGDRPAQYILGGNDVLLITVNLWGHVQRPGIYSVPSDYGLVDLISSAGGPKNSARLSDVRIVRKNQQVLIADVESYIKTGDSSVLPVIQPGDTIVISGNVTDVITKILSILRDVAIIANVIVIASRVN